MKEKSYSVSYDVALAKEFGIPVAVLVGNVRYFSTVNKADGKGDYYHSMKAIAEATGLSYGQVRAAAQKAKEAGLIDYRSGYKPGTTEKTTYWSAEKTKSEVAKTSTSGVSKTPTSLTNNKKDNKLKELDTNVSRAKSHDDEQKEYGNPDINAIFKAWSDAGLPAITSRVQSSRRTIWSMLRNKAIGAERLKQGIELAGEAYGEPYAPIVLNFEDLSRKLTALEAWKQRQTALAEKPKHQPSLSSYSPTYSGEIAHERRPYDGRPEVLDREQINDERVTPEFLAECRKKFIK